MAWQPWWDRLAEIHSAHEREEFIRGVAGYPQAKPGKLFGNALSALLIGWGVSGMKQGK
jgi:hypothetical protein